MSEVRVHQGSLVSGARFADRYEIIELLGSGAFGEVYKAWHEELSRHVAIKLLKSDFLDGEGVARFEREAKALNALKHRNITSVYSFGVADGAPYMVTEYAPGVTLRDKLLARKRLHPGRALRILTQVLSALHCAHLQGVVHRDLKPANIMLLRDESGHEVVKLIDFGLAKLTSQDKDPKVKLTETGMTVGTCHYMSPEQCRGMEVDGRSDLYAAGCVLYECLTGTMPFDARESLAVMYQHLNNQAKPLSEYRNLYSSDEERYGFQQVVSTCMEKDLARRYKNAEEVIADLNAISAGTPELVRTAPTPVKALNESHVASRARKPMNPNVRNVLVGVAWGLGIAFVVGCCVWGWIQLLARPVTAVAGVPGTRKVQIAPTGRSLEKPRRELPDPPLELAKLKPAKVVHFTEPFRDPGATEVQLVKHIAHDARENNYPSAALWASELGRAYPAPGRIPKSELSNVFDALGNHCSDCGPITAQLFVRYRDDLPRNAELPRRHSVYPENTKVLRVNRQSISLASRVKSAYTQSMSEEDTLALMKEAADLNQYTLVRRLLQIVVTRHTHPGNADSLPSLVPLLKSLCDKNQPGLALEIARRYGLSGYVSNLMMRASSPP